ncbi:uncharacterized protein LOC135682178 [Rhopilema esculentum]|uniref:uncharacterized protein LOC135682178 n=1 Tax=Rhopilema esculentum TaxID=499914 RepID=UPI0031E39E63
MHKQPDSLDVFVGSASAILERVKRLQLKYNHKTTTSCFDEKQDPKGFSVSDSVATGDLDISRGKGDHTLIKKGYDRDIANDFESKISNDVSNITRLSCNSEHLHNVPGDLLEKTANRKFTVQLDKRSSCSLEDLGSGFGLSKVRSPCFSSEEDLRSFRQRDANSSMNSYEISRLLKELDDVVDPEKRAKHYEVGPENGKQLKISQGPNEENDLNGKALSCEKSNACEINLNGISSPRIIGHGDKKIHSNGRVEQGSFGFSLGGNQELEFERKCQSVSETKLFNETTCLKTSVSDKGESLMTDVELSEQNSVEQQNGVRNGQKNISCAVEENIRAEFYSVFDNYKEICADKAAGISSIIGENGNFESNDFINRGESRDNSILEKTKNDIAGEFVSCSPLAKDGRSHFLEAEQNEQFLKNEGLIKSVEKLNEELVSTGETSKIEEFVDLEREKPLAGEESENFEQPQVYLGQLVDDKRYMITSVEDIFTQNSYLGKSDCIWEESCSIDMAHGKGVSDLKKHFEKYQPTSSCISNEKPVSPNAPKTKEGTSSFPKKRGIGALKSMFESPNETKMNASPVSQDGSQRIGSPNLGRSEQVMRESKSKVKNNGSTVVGAETLLQRQPQDEGDIKTMESKCLDEGASETRLAQEGLGINDGGFDFRSEMISDAKDKPTFHESPTKPLKVPPPIKRKPSLKKTDNSAKNKEISKDNLTHADIQKAGAVKDQSIVVENTTAKERIENGGQSDDTLQAATDNFKDRKDENIGQEENQNTEARPNPEGQCLDDGKLTLPERVEGNEAFEKKDSGTDADKEQELVKKMLLLKSKKEQHLLQHSDVESSEIETKEVNSFKTEDARVCQPCLVNNCSENGLISNESCSFDQQPKNVKRGITYDPISEPLSPTNPFTNEEKQSHEGDLEKSLESSEKESETLCGEAINEPITQEYNNRELSNGTTKPNTRKKLLQCRSYSESSDSSFEESWPITQQAFNYDNLPKLGLPKLLKEAVLSGEVSGSLENKTEDLMGKQGEQETFHDHYVSYSQKASDIKCQAAELGIYTKAACSMAKDKTPNCKTDASMTSIEQRSEVEAKSAKEALKKLDSRLVIIKEEASKLGIKPISENITQTKDTTKRKSPAPIIIQSTPSMSDRSGLPNVAKVSPYFHDSKSRKFIEPLQRFGANIFGDLLQEDELDGMAGEDPLKTDEQIGHSLKRNPESKGHSLEEVQKLIIGLDISSSKQKLGGIDIGVVSIDGMKTWTEVEEEAVNTFLEHLKLIDESGLDITHADIKYLTIGRHQIALGAGKDLKCYSTDETHKTHRMEIKGNALSNVATLAYQSLIPKNTLEKYISLALNHRCLVFSGPSGTGKSYLAHMIADTISSRIVKNENNNNLEPIHTVNVDAERWKELKKLIDNRAEESLPVIVVIDGFSPEFQEGIENLSLLLKESDNKNVYVIAALDQANTEDVDVKWQESMRWICFNNNEEPVCGLLIRYLRKKFLNNNPSSDWDDLFKLSKWIFSVWKQLNKVIEKFHSPEKSIGPAMFFSCPTKKDEIEEWFVDLWNYSLAPYILHVMRTGIKLFGQQEWIDPLETILDTYPWQQEENLRAKIKKIRKDDVGYREALPREEGLATASTDQVRLMNFLRRLETLVENKRIVTETKPGTSQRRIYLESTL